MPKNKNTCDCELCLFKTFPLDNPIVNNTDKIIEAIIHHFVIRLGTLVKSQKEINSYVIRFITMVNQSYISSNNTSDLLKKIKLIYTNIMVSGICCKYSNNASMNKLIHKEASYLKTIISSMQEAVQENVEGEKVVEDEVKEEVEEKSFIVVENNSPTSQVSTSQVSTSQVSTSQVPTIIIENVIKDIETISNDNNKVVEDVKTVVEDVKDGIVDLSDEIVPVLPKIESEVAGSYLSYCVIN